MMIGHYTVELSGGPGQFLWRSIGGPPRSGRTPVARRLAPASALRARIRTHIGAACADVGAHFRATLLTLPGPPIDRKAPNRADPQSVRDEPKVADTDTDLVEVDPTFVDTNRSLTDTTSTSICQARSTLIELARSWPKSNRSRPKLAEPSPSSARIDRNLVQIGQCGRRRQIGSNAIQCLPTSATIG